jgi:hypothetical protein
MSGCREAVLCSAEGGYRAIYIVGEREKGPPPGGSAACCSLEYALQDAL